MAVRRWKALELHRGGATYRRIAAELKVSRETARKDIRAVLAKVAANMAPVQA